METDCCLVSRAVEKAAFPRRLSIRTFEGLGFIRGAVQGVIRSDRLGIASSRLPHLLVGYVLRKVSNGQDGALLRSVAARVEGDLEVGIDPGAIPCPFPDIFFLLLRCVEGGGVGKDLVLVGLGEPRDHKRHLAVRVLGEVDRAQERVDGSSRHPW